MQAVTIDKVRSAVTDAWKVENATCLILLSCGEWRSYVYQGLGLAVGATLIKSITSLSWIHFFGKTVDHSDAILVAQSYFYRGNVSPQQRSSLGEPN